MLILKSLVMILTLKKEQTGLQNYTDTAHCPIATALRNKGYRFVSCGPDSYTAMKFIMGFIPWYVTGEIPDHINEKAHIWADKEQDNDITFEL